MKVVMSDAQRQMVESAVRGLGNARIDTPEEQLSHVTTATGALETQLAKLGFDPRDVQEAIAAYPPGNSISLPGLLDWLCLNLPESRLPSSFTRGITLACVLFQTNAEYRQLKSNTCKFFLRMLESTTCMKHTGSKTERVEPCSQLM